MLQENIDIDPVESQNDQNFPQGNYSVGLPVPGMLPQHSRISLETKVFSRSAQKQQQLRS